MSDGTADRTRREELFEVALLFAAAVAVLLLSAFVARRPVSSVTIPILALVAFAFRRIRLGLAMLMAGVGVYLVAKLVKGLVDRGRPGAVLDGIYHREVFEEGSLGFPSGHAAVATALTFVVWRHLGPRWGVAALALAIVVMIGRMYVGAHLPLDLVGGAALGAVAASIANVAVPPDRRG
jgi:membrane-associated phospholipid phosphatase